MKKFLKNAYAIVLSALCAAAFILLLVRAEDKIIYPLIGGVAGLLLAPFFHEAGHAFFAKINGFRVVYLKFFVFKYDHTGEKRRFSLCSPFAAEETRAMPESAGNMKKRAAAYSAGGLIFGLLWCVLLAVAAACTIGKDGAAENVSLVFLGALPYAAYLFFLNVALFCYGGGKTDGLIFTEIVKDKPCGVRFVATLNAQGRLNEGKSYAEIDREFLYSLPAIAEDEPLFIANLFQLYYAETERGNTEAAAGYLNRIASLSAYLTREEESLALCELLYTNSCVGDEEQAEKCFGAVNARNGEKKEKAPSANLSVAEKRALAAYYKMKGSETESLKYTEKGLSLTSEIRTAGERKTEELLLKRL